MTSPATDPFVSVELGADRLLLQREVASELPALLVAFLQGDALPDAGIVPGGRGTTLRVRLRTGGAAILRRNLRGGMPARLVRDAYFGFAPRPFAELRANERLREIGLPVPEPLGAIARRIGPGIYRGAVATREIGGSENLWEFLRAATSAEEKRAVCARTVALIDRVLAAGAFHPDLNLKNFLVTAAEPRLWLIDCDGVRFIEIGARHRRRALARLRRSAQRLDPSGVVVDPAWFGVAKP